MLRALSVLAVVLAAAGPLHEDQPVASQPVAGAVSGRITPAGRVERITAVSRVTGKVDQPDQFDKTTGRFLFSGLPGDARYDLVVTVAGGRQLEGIDLDFVDQRLLRLAEQRRAALGVPAEPHRPFTRADADEIVELIALMQDFMDIRRVLYVGGQEPRATVLVELMRTREFHGSKAGEVIWRVELWYFEVLGGSWQRLPDQDRILRRERLPLDQWQKIDVEYYPQLSVYVSPDGASLPLEFTVPDQTDPSRGRPAGSAIDIETPAIILGLDRDTAPPPPATSQAAG